jgi:membrane-associated phospholipid phosphatase
MYLGIHWAVDVVGGICLGAVSVIVADKLTYITK